MADKKNTKKTVAKKTDNKKIKKKVEKIVAEDKSSDKKSCACINKKESAKLLSTVIISSLVSITIVVSTPFWMNDLIPVEKQPSFLRKAMMPVTNVKVIKTKPLPNDLDKLFDAADKHMKEEITEFKSEINKEIESQENKLKSLESEFERVERISENMKTNIEEEVLKNKLFLVSFYNMYDKAISGKNYSVELDLFKLTMDKNLAKDLSWLEAYQAMPPRDLKSIALDVEEKYSDIVIENINNTETGLKNKFYVALNKMFKIRTPMKKLNKGSLKYNLSGFINSAKSGNVCASMSFSNLLLKQSEWFRSNIANEMEARYRVNKQLKSIKAQIEKDVYIEEVNKKEPVIDVDMSVEEPKLTM